MRAVSAGPRMELYAPGGRRRILPPLVFGAGVLWHLLRHGGRYDVVHTASFPYFSLLAAALARPLRRFRLVVDWHEVWTREYWREYLGRRGRPHRPVRAAPLRARAAARLLLLAPARRGACARSGVRGEVTVLEGEYAGSLEAARAAEAAEPLVVFAGRHIPEKRVPALVPALALARERIAGAARRGLRRRPRARARCCGSAARARARRRASTCRAS